MGFKMNTDAEKLLKIQNAVKQMVENKETPEYIDGFLQSQGENADTIRALNQYGADKVAEARTSQREFQEKQDSLGHKVWSYAKTAPQALMGGLEGALHGTELALQGATLGGYGWLNKKIGGNFEQRKEEFQREAEEAGLGLPYKIGKFAAEFGGALKSPVYNITPFSKAAETSNLANYGRLGELAAKNAWLGDVALAGGIGRALQGAFEKDTLQDLPSDFGKGALVAGGIGAVARGAGKALSEITGVTTGKGASATSGAFDAGKRNSKAFRQGAKMSADDLVAEAQAGRDKIYKAAQENIAAGKQAIAKQKVDKQGLYKAIQDFARKNYTIDGKVVASSGEMKVLKEVEKVINKFDKVKNYDVGTVDRLKQQIYKIVPDNPTDKFAKTARDKIYGIVSEYLNKASPKYANIMKPYQNAMNELAKIAETTGVSSTTKATTAINKLTKAAKNPETQKILQKVGGQDLVDKLIGYEMQGLLPGKGLSRAVAGVLGLSSAGGNVGAMATLPWFSPRAVGNINYMAGRASNYLPSIEEATRLINYRMG